MKNSKKSEENKKQEKEHKIPVTLFELFIYLIKKLIKSIPQRIIFSVITVLVVMGIHTYLMVYVNDGFGMDSKSTFLNNLLMLTKNSWRSQTLSDSFRLFNVTLFWMLLSIVFWSTVGQIRSLGIKMFLLKVADSFIKLFSDIFEKPGSSLLSLFIGSICVGLLLGIIVGNPLVCILLTALIFLSVSARGTSLLLLVLYLTWSDFQRLLRIKQKRGFYVDIVSMALRGISLGFLVYSIMPFVKFGGVIQYVVLVAMICLFLLNIIKRNNSAISASIIFLLGTIFINHLTAQADDGGWSESGRSFWGWLGSEGAWESFKKGLEPALFAASMAIGFVPVLGDIKDAQEALTGIDLITGERLSGTDRLITALAMFIPIVNGKALRTTGDIAEFALKYEDEVSSVMRRVDDIGDTTINSFTAPGRTELDVYRGDLGVPDRHTVAVAKTDVPGLEGATFSGASPRVRREADLADLDTVAPNREIKSPSLDVRGTRHAEEGVMHEFDEAIKKAELNPNDVTGTLSIHQSNPRGVCTTCIQGINNPDVAPGIFKQFSDKYPNLTIKVTSEIVEGVKSAGKQFFTLLNGKFID